MHSFLWTGKDTEGKERSAHVTAENAQAARGILEGRGWTQLELVTDEICDETRRQIPPMTSDWDALPDDAETEAARWKGNSSSFLGEWWRAIFQAKLTLALFVLILVVGMLRHGKWSIGIGIAGLVIMVLLFPLISAFFSQSVRNYSRLNKAKVWGRWQEVLHCVEQLKRSHRLTRIGVGDVELARNRALALASSGHLDEALKELSRFEGNPSLSTWLYTSHLAGIYDGARQFEKALELRQRVATEKPDTAAVWIDVAYSLVRGLNQPAEAREALGRAEKLEISGVGKAYLYFLRGIILWRENKPAEAKEQLDRALAGFEPMKHHDLVEGLILFSKSYLCAVQGQLGNQREAQILFRQVEKFLTAHREEELLQACRRGISSSR